jgi:hypothetical protein
MSFIGTKRRAGNVFAPPGPMAQLFINCIREVAKPPAKKENRRRHVGSWPIVLKKSVDVAEHHFFRFMEAYSELERGGPNRREPTPRRSLQIELRGQQKSNVDVDLS